MRSAVQEQLELLFYSVLWTEGLDTPDRRQPSVSLSSYDVFSCAGTSLILCNQCTRTNIFKITWLSVTENNDIILSGE